jgi:4'-phosphopantetheinyl transferase
VYWLQQTESDVPANDGWLSASEIAYLNGTRFAKRRMDWRLGRWTAKQAISAYLSREKNFKKLTEIEIRPDLLGAPEAFITNHSAGVTVSISHRGGVAVCAAAAADVELGCDLELIEPHSAAFIGDYFTEEEQELIALTPVGDRAQLVALLWSAKESALKALRIGLRLNMRQVVVKIDNEPKEAASYLGLNDTNWRSLQVHCTSNRSYTGWWQAQEHLLRTLVAAPPLGPPKLLAVA